MFDVDTCASMFTETELDAARKAIPQSERVEHKKTHPWINDVSLSLIEAKRKAEGTPQEFNMRLACSIGFVAERQKYIPN